MDDTTITIDSTPEKAKTLVMQATCLSCGFTHQQEKPLLPGYRYEITEEVASRQPCPRCHGKFAAKFTEEDTFRYPNEIKELREEESVNIRRDMWLLHR